MTIYPAISVICRYQLINFFKTWGFSHPSANFSHGIGVVYVWIFLVLLLSPNHIYELEHWHQMASSHPQFSCYAGDTQYTFCLETLKRLWFFYMFFSLFQSMTNFGCTLFVLSKSFSGTTKTRDKQLFLLYKICCWKQKSIFTCCAERFGYWTSFSVWKCSNFFLQNEHERWLKRFSKSATFAQPQITQCHRVHYSFEID